MTTDALPGSGSGTASRSRPPKPRPYRRPDSPFVWYWVHWKGERVRHPTPYTTMREAEEWCKQLRVVLHAKYYGQEPMAPEPEVRPRTLKEVCEVWLGRQVVGRVSQAQADNAPGQIRAIYLAFGEDTLAQSIKDPEMDAYINGQYALGRKSNTIRNRIMTMRQCYKAAGEPIPWTVPAPAKEVREICLEWDHVRAMVEGLDMGVKSHRGVLLAAYTGLRAADVVKVEWPDLREGFVVARTGKKRKWVRVPLPRRVWDRLERHRGTGRVCPTTTSALRKMLSSLGTEGPHAYRHTYSSALHAAGADDMTVAKICGWGGSQVGDYVTVEKKRLMAIAEALPY